MNKEEIINLFKKESNDMKKNDYLKKKIEIFEKHYDWKKKNKDIEKTIRICKIWV